jgi:hypothetical protein|tara:strand:+ start:129 stop:317 length:189 start_codon:yes stop_codon:yes gene_type:complete
MEILDDNTVQITELKKRIEEIERDFRKVMRRLGDLEKIHTRSYYVEPDGEISEESETKNHHV